MLKRSYDIVIIGSGMGGATAALSLAPSGASILIIEKGHQLPEAPENRDARAIFQRGHFRTNELWYDTQSRGFSPGNNYNHGGNTKFYGAVLFRYRERDFDGVAHTDGDTPPWPFRYGELSPWYDRAEQLYQVRGDAKGDATEPPHGQPYPHSPVPDEPAIAIVRGRLSRIGLKPFSLPLGVDIDRWLSVGQTGFDAFPDARSGKMDAETCALLPALEYPNVEMVSGAEVTRLISSPDGKRVEFIEFDKSGEVTRVAASTVLLAAGAVRSAALLLASKDGGLANRSGVVGRHFMAHNASAVMAIDPRFRNNSVYQKTFGLNDFYLSGPRGGPPLGNVQLLGRVSGPILKAHMPRVPEPILHGVAQRSADFFALSEDLPLPENRVLLDGRKIVLDIRRNNMSAMHGLVRELKSALREAGFPLVVSKLFDHRAPSHQCGTIRMGSDPATAAVDSFGRSFEVSNLFVVDASTLASSAAVNPSLTVAALAMRAAAHILRSSA
jgi:choline dehydrogenase-like flavoprotein